MVSDDHFQGSVLIPAPVSIEMGAKLVEEEVKGVHGVVSRRSALWTESISLSGTNRVVLFGHEPFGDTKTCQELRNKYSENGPCPKLRGFAALHTSLFSRISFKYSLSAPGYLTLSFCRIVSRAAETIRY